MNTNGSRQLLAVSAHMIQVQQYLVSAHVASKASSGTSHFRHCTWHSQRKQTSPKAGVRVFIFYFVLFLLSPKLQ